MKKLIIIPILALSLSGCFWQTVNSSDIETAIARCKQEYSTVVEISANFVGEESVLCSNRQKYALQGKELK